MARIAEPEGILRGTGPICAASGRICGLDMGRKTLI